jgi:hypothetical protein
MFGSKKNNGELWRDLSVQIFDITHLRGNCESNPVIFLYS